MNDQRLDRRVQRTRALLRDALFALIEEKGYASITILDITERANLNRVTFYFHYKDKEDLLFKVMQDLYDDLIAKQPPTNSLKEWLHQDALFAFRHVQQYVHLYKVLLSEKGSFSLIGRLIDYFAKTAIDKAHTTLAPDTQFPLPLEVVEHFYAGAFIGLVRWWVVNDMPYTPEEMATMCHQLEANSGLWAWGLDEHDLSAF
ncbi:MAG: TetR/AcrR family transcriptional regulator [Anaerolineae bacterium]|jgi:AcrR family transcriptional regulator|nr:TetR/AcrR family transcriptional regulator [Anaerolineae bacterium]